MTQEIHLTCNNLTIRNFVLADITTEYLSWLNDDEVVKYSGQRFASHDQESSLSYLKSFENTDNLFLLVSDSTTGKSIGTMTVYRQLHHGVADVGIMIGNRQFWGIGVGFSAWATVISFLLTDMGVRKVTAGTIRSNKPMLGIMERSGMSCEAILPGQQLLNGQPEDVFLYAKYNSEI